MITLITGVPGSGKTLRAVFLIMKALDAGRLVFTDIDGFDHPNVQTAPNDWRDTPEGSFVVYDEAQKTYPSTGKAGRVDDERITALETHRHTGHDIIFITQAPTLIHHHIRKLVGLHIHVHRAAGLKRATLYTWDFCSDTPNDRREQERADTENWFYPKDLFQHYKSATIHTHKFNVPKKIAFALAAVVLVLGYVFYRLFSDGGLNVLNLAETTSNIQPQGALPDLSGAPAVVGLPAVLDTAQIVEPLSGCISTDLSCRCFNKDGYQINMTFADCKNTASAPLPINLFGSGNDNNRQRGVGDTSPTQTPLTSQSSQNDGSAVAAASGAGDFSSKSADGKGQINAYGAFRD